MDVGFSLACRSALEDRAVVLGGDRGELLGGLGVLARGEDAAGVVRVSRAVGGQRSRFCSRVRALSGWVWAASCMTRSGCSGRAFDEACGYLDGFLGCSLRGVVFGEWSPWACSVRAGSSGGGLEAGVSAGLVWWGCVGWDVVRAAGVVRVGGGVVSAGGGVGRAPGFLIGHSVGELVGGVCGGSVLA